ncbi:ABC transporter ATP-binding protein [Salininema proteolyticum]|uniref:ABC transporter ATP-binding protein n=1 Tax=Salininema proteolyticum TaxID=1607685 RepID=A0ABV8U160_9ACTN
MPDRAGLRGARLRLSYRDKEVVHGADLAVEPGRVTVLIGPNGSGKSTLLRGLARLHRADAGTVSFPDGTDSSTLHPKEFARSVALLSQSRPAPGGITVADVVAYGRHPYRGRFRHGDAEGAAVVERAMKLCGVEHMADRGVEALSGGEKQRVWFATALAQDTDTLLLDEPTNHLDLRYQMETLDLVRDLADDHGTAVGVVLHDLNQAAAVADTIVLLHGGEIRAAGTPDEVLTSENLSDVYGIAIDVDRDEGGLTCRPVSRHRSRRALTAA